MKYVDVKVVFRELPNEITLAINLSGCPCKCVGCHSPYLANDVGTLLTNDELDMLIRKNIGITAVCFMGGDANPLEVEQLARHIQNEWSRLLHVGWYSGRNVLPDNIDLGVFDYIKIGKYIQERGPLNKSTTNQKMYRVSRDGVNISLTDITSHFWVHHYTS